MKFFLHLAIVAVILFGVRYFLNSANNLATTNSLVAVGFAVVAAQISNKLLNKK